MTLLKKRNLGAISADRDPVQMPNFSAKSDSLLTLEGGRVGFDAQSRKGPSLQADATIFWKSA